MMASIRNSSIPFDDGRDSESICEEIHNLRTDVTIERPHYTEMNEWSRLTRVVSPTIDELEYIQQFGMRYFD